MNGNLRIGHGVDVHRFADSYQEDKPLKLGGIVLAEKYSLEAHSDGDVVLHGICDAILGACAAGDIGDHFPDTDEKFANIDSAHLLEQVLQIADKKHFHILNVDITVIAQVPKLSPYRQAMTANLCDLLSLDSDRVNLKATTTERLGSIGREEGIACHAVVLMDSNV
jgi:2-C-methyl-D-erythritol 2,4-cyclodiphosphate synthase